jgi:phosphatidylinositol glycan class A protein
MVTIAMISDFFFPNVGGVEAHIYSLAFCLRKLGHKIIILTRDRDDFGITGTRYFSNGIKVYYIPCSFLSSGIMMPCLASCMSFLIRDILKREDIQICHMHQSTSLLAIISTFVAKAMDLPLVFTQHSLHDFEDLASVELNNLYQYMAKYNIARTICVSNTVKENIILRLKVPAEHAVVIPNAIDHHFYNKRIPKLTAEPDTIKIIFMTRMTFRKGVDLFIEIMPAICRRYKNVRFLVCGDGPKRSLIEFVVREYSLESQVEFQGFKNIEDVPEIHSSGDIFLCTSISEAFCLAILEASACGLYVISTDVGGISEILPKEAISLCQPSPKDLIEKLCHVLDEKRYLKCFNTRRIIEDSYCWDKVAISVEKTYKQVLDEYKKGDWTVILQEVISNTFQMSHLLVIILISVVGFFFFDLFFSKHNKNKAINENDQE